MQVYTNFYLEHSGYIPPALAAAPAPVPLAVRPQMNQDNHDNDAQPQRSPLRYSNRNPRRVESQTIKSKNKVDHKRHKKPVKQGRAPSRWR